MNLNDFGHVSIVFEHDMMSAHAYRVKSFNFSNIRIRIRIRTDFYIKICIRRMRILINSITSLVTLNDPEYLLHIKFRSPCLCKIIHELLTNRVGVHWGCGRLAVPIYIMALLVCSISAYQRAVAHVPSHTYLDAFCLLRPLRWQWIMMMVVTESDHVMHLSASSIQSFYYWSLFDRQTKTKRKAMLWQGNCT